MARRLGFCGSVSIWQETQERLHACGDIESGRYTLARDVGRNGAKCFDELWASRRSDSRIEKWGDVKWLDDCARLLLCKDRKSYEVLRVAHPSRLFLDIEWPEKEESGNDNNNDNDNHDRSNNDDERKKIESVFNLLEEYCIGWESLENRLVFASHRKGKRSYHVLFPDAVFEDVTCDMKKLVLGFVYWLHTKRTEGDAAKSIVDSLWYTKETKGWDKRKPIVWDRCIIDTFVYTSNRCFRLPLQSKGTDARKTQLTLDRRLSRCPREMLQPSALWFVQAMGGLPKMQVDTEKISAILEGKRLANVMHSYPCAYKIENEGDGSVNDANCGGKKVTSHYRRLITIGEKSRPIVVIKSNKDILELLDPAELKAIDFGSVYLPILADLLQCFNVETVTDWLGGRNIKTEKHMNYALTFVHPRVLGDGCMHCQFALNYLKKMHKGVKDMRCEEEAFVRVPKVNTIEPRTEDGWIFVSKSDGFRKTLQNYFPQRKNQYKHKSKDVQMHNTLMITGKMGVGKTEELLRFAKTRLRQGCIRSVLYLAPRTLLVDQAAMRFRDLHLMRGIHRRRQIKTLLYHSGVDGDMRIENEHEQVEKTTSKCYSLSRSHKTETKASDDNGDDGTVFGYFHAACVNSVNKTPVDHDIIIVDEAVVNIGNLFMHTAKMFHKLTMPRPTSLVGEDEMNSEATKMPKVSKDLYDKAIEGDKACLQGVIERLRKANILFYVDAAFTDASMKALTSLYDDCKALPLDSWLQTMENRHVRSRLKAQTQEHRHVLCNYYQTTSHVHIAPVRKIALYDPDRPRGVFTQINHYTHKDDLLNELIRELLMEKKRNIVYVSSSRMAALLARDVDIAIKSRSDTVPSIGVLSAETVHKDKDSYILLKDRLDNVVLAIVTSIVSCGLSFNQHHYFDTAYAFIELGRGLPPPADMVQLTARVRSLSTKILNYNVTCAGPISDLLVRMYQGARRKELLVDTTLYNFHEANVAEFKQANDMAANPPLARAVMKQLFINAFTHVIDKEGTVFKPTCLDVVTSHDIESDCCLRANCYLPKRQDKTSYLQMCSELPNDHILIAQSDSKRPIKRSRSDITKDKCISGQKYAKVSVPTEKLSTSNTLDFYSPTYSKDHYLFFEQTRVMTKP